MIEAQNKAAEILGLCGYWLVDSGKPMLLGDRTTMADVLLMNMLSRLTMNKAFFAKHVTSNESLSKYWLAHK